MAKIEEVEGIGPAYAAKLGESGITTTDHLLEKGASPKGRDEIAASSGVSAKLVLEWVNHVDLMRINGVGSEYADLLEAAGIDSVPELAQRVAANLAAKLVEVNDAKKLVRAVPSESQVADWISEAKRLPGIVTH